MSTKELDPNAKGDEVMKQTGILEQATDLLKDFSTNDKSDKEEIGSWLTVIGRVLLEIFK